MIIIKKCCVHGFSMISKSIIVMKNVAELNIFLRKIVVMKINLVQIDNSWYSSILVSYFNCDSIQHCLY